MTYTKHETFGSGFLYSPGLYSRSILHSCYSLNSVCGRHEVLRPQSNTLRDMFYFKHVILNYLNIFSNCKSTNIYIYAYVFFQNKSSATYIFCKMSLLLSTRGGGSCWCWTTRWESPHNQSHCKWGSPINWRCCPPYVDCFLHRLVGRIDPWLAIMIGQS